MGPFSHLKYFKEAMPWKYFSFGIKTALKLYQVFLKKQRGRHQLISSKKSGQFFCFQASIHFHLSNLDLKTLNRSFRKLEISFSVINLNKS